MYFNGRGNEFRIYPRAAKIEQIDRLTALAESRRNAVLREIERHRSTFAQLLRDKVQDVQDAEFETIEPKSIPQNDTADKKAA